MKHKSDFKTRYLEIIAGDDPSAYESSILFLLRILQIFYRLGIGIHHIYYRVRERLGLVYRAGCPVICIGNLSAGGTGKTPMVVWLAKHLTATGLRVVIISRGYGEKNETGENDEAREIAHFLPDVPHLQSPDRVAAAKKAVNELHADVILLDDGFQHRRLHRDMNIVLLDATQGATFSLMPRGLLREPVSALRRADAVVITRSDQGHYKFLQKLKNIATRNTRPGVFMCLASHRPVCFENISGEKRELSDFRDRNVGIFCGIGNPDGFIRTVNEINAADATDIQCVKDENCTRIYPDHYPYTPESLEELRKWAVEQNFDALICTWKDLIKIQRAALSDIPIYALKIEMTVSDEEKLLAAVKKVIE